MRSLTNFIVIVAIATTIIFFGCHQEPKEIKIGAVLPLTGIASAMGEHARQGLELAIVDVNDKGGLNGKKIKLIIEDGASDPKISVSALKKLIEVDKCKINVTFLSSVSLSLAPIADKSRTILFANTTHPGISGISPYVFRHGNTAQQEAEVISSFLGDSLKSKQIAIVSINDDYGVAFSEAVEKASRNKGIEIVEKILYEKTEIDFRTIVKKAILKKPDCVVVAGFGKGLGLLVKRLREIKYRGSILSQLTFTLSDAALAAGDAARGVYYTELVFSGTEYDSFKERYFKKYNTTAITAEVPLFYNTILLLTEAMKTVGYDPEKIKETVRQMSQFQGLGEILTIQPNGDILPQIKVAVYR